MNGRYGPYITDKERNAKIPKDKDPKSLTLEECQTLLAAAPVRTFGKWGRGKKGQAPKAKGGATVPPAVDADAAGAKPVKRTTARKQPPAPKPSTTGGQKLAAKASKTAADKKAPVQPAAPPKTSSKAKPKPKKIPAKKKA